VSEPAPSATRRASRPSAIRVDLQLIADMIGAGSRVLDVGCGDGTLLAYLVAEKGVAGRGIEISRAGVNACVRRGLSVVQGDADTDLKDYPDDSFNYVVLSQTLQATHNPREVLLQLLRIGRCAIVSFPNFGYWRCRVQLALGGHMPVTETLDNPWPLLHDQRLPRAVPRRGHHGRAQIRAQARRLDRRLLGERVSRQPVRRTGGVHAEPRDGSASARRYTGSQLNTSAVTSSG
jgi:methionine biosynthesis protein MetW